MNILLMILSDQKDKTNGKQGKHKGGNTKERNVEKRKTHKAVNYKQHAEGCLKGG